MKGELTDGPPLRRLVAFGLPLVVGTVAHGLFNLVDVWLVGRYAPSGEGALPREASLAAIHASSVLNFLPMLVANGLSVATIAVVARSIGAGDGARAADDVNRSMIVTLLLGLVVGGIAGITARAQIDALRVAPEAFDTAVRCLEVMSYGSVSMFALLQVTAIERAAGRSFPPLVLLTGANVVNAVAAVLLVPRFGAVGAAWCTVLARGAFAVLGIAWLYGRQPEFRRWPGAFGTLVRECVRLVRLAIPASLQIFSRALAVIFVTRFLAPVGGFREPVRATTDVTAAYGVALRLEMIAMFACVGWGTAAAAAVGQNLGAGRVDRAIRMGWLGALIAAASMVVIGGALYFSAPKLFPFFLEEQDPDRLRSIVDYGTEYFRILAFAYAFVGIGIVLAEAINGAGATRVSFLVDFLGYVVLLLGLALLFRKGHERTGLWWALFAVHAVVAGTYAFLFARVLRARARA
ncbi:MAG TPA: MATE family efflux transporter [Planctomycetota bacterium]|nr:MATE family efflux transporter [Planctomycetota bacterium]